MNMTSCPNCGASDFITSGRYLVCTYCDSKYVLPSKPTATPKTTGENATFVNNEVQQLLIKCRTDPRNAKKYANLILDIDPSNAEARRYLY